MPDRTGTVSGNRASSSSWRDHCRDRGLHSLADLDPADIPSCYAGIVRVMLHLLRLVYFTPADTREAGFIETGHFGVRFPGRASHIDVTEVTQRWLRDLLWDHLAELMRSAHRPRCGGAGSIIFAGPASS